MAIFTDDSLALLKIFSFPFVQSVVPMAKKRQTENEPIHEKHLVINPGCVAHNDYGDSFDQINQVGGTSLHAKGFRGDNMLIAFLDAGFLNADLLSAFDSINNRNGIMATHDFITGNDSVYEDNSHGTNCLSIAAGNMPGYFIGTAPAADYILLRTEEGGSEFPVEELNWAAGAEFADSMGADIISSSLGYSLFDTVFTNGNALVFDHSYLDMNGKTNPSSIAASIASSRGIIVCNSAGNSGGEPWRYITSPADADNILAVGAVDSKSNYAWFSGHGPTFDGRIKPDVVARGDSTLYIHAITGLVSSGNGTSFSCPIIAGLTACLWQAHPEKNYLQIMNAIRRSASKYFTPDNNIGYGIPNFTYADLYLSEFNETQLNSADSVLVYPTLFSDELKINIKSKADDDIFFELYDMAGKLVYEDCRKSYVGFNAFEIQLPSISSGVYLLKIYSDHIYHIEKTERL